MRDDRVVIPAGSFVYGEVVTARRAGRVKGRSEIRVRLDRLVLPNGYSVRFNALPTNVIARQHTEAEEDALCAQTQPVPGTWCWSLKWTPLAR